jgi:hypothetical protein
VTIGQTCMSVMRAAGGMTQKDFQPPAAIAMPLSIKGL